MIGAADSRIRHVRIGRLSFEQRPIPDDQDAPDTPEPQESPQRNPQIRTRRPHRKLVRGHTLAIHPDAIAGSKLPVRDLVFRYETGFA